MTEINLIGMEPDKLRQIAGLLREVADKNEMIQNLVAGKTTFGTTPVNQTNNNGEKRRGRPPGSGNMSPEARAKIAEAQKKRWAKVHAEREQLEKAQAAKKAEAQKKRDAKKAAKNEAAPAASAA